MGSHRQGRLLVVGFSLLAVGACKKTRTDTGPEPAPRSEPGAGESASTAEPDPHAGLDVDDPHAGIPMRGDGDMGGGGMAGATPTVTADGKSIVGPLALAVPPAWKAEPTTSGMRAAQWKIPGAKGAGDAELVAFYFGAQGAGSAADNIQRWAEQFDAGGHPAQPKKSTRTLAGMQSTLVELEGRYVSSMTPGGPEKQDKPDHMMLGLIIETPQGPYYYKLTGPKATVESVRASFAQMVANIRPAAADAPAANQK
jgi:hypothetical protein